MFDLTVLPFSTESSREQTELPGLLVAAAPRKAARLRAQDQLLLYMRLVSKPVGKAGLTPAQQQEILSRLSETYFTTSGSVTAGLRAAVTRLNDFLLNRNLKNAQEGQWVGLLNLAVIHNGTLIAAHGGPTHTFVLSPSQVLHFTDSQGMRGLGMSRNAVPRFYQASVQSGDLLLVCAEPPQAWTEKTLANSPQLNLDHLRRRLLSEANGTLQGVLLRFQEGKGQVSYWKPSAREDRRTGPRPDQLTPAAPGAGQSSPVPQRPAASAAAVSTEPQQAQKQTETRPEAATNAASAGMEEAAAEPAAAPVELHTADLSTEGKSNGVDHSPTSVEPEAVEPVSQSEVSGAEEEPEGYAAESSEDEPSTSDDESSSDVAENTEEVGGFIPPWEDLPASSSQPAPDLDDEKASEVVYLNRAAANQPTAETPSPRPTAGVEQPERAVPTYTATAAVASTAAAAEANPANAEGTASSTSAASHSPVEGAAPVRPERRERPAPKQKPARVKPAGPPRPNPMKIWLSKAWQNSSGARIAASRALLRVFPQRKEPLVNIPPSVMLLISIAIPLIVVTVATTVYMRAGQEEQYQREIALAQQYAQTAASHTDPVRQRENWEQVYSLVKAAEQYNTTEESETLKRQALGHLDKYDGIVRLNFQPVNPGGLGKGVNIRSMVTTPTGVYLLDSANGSILHMANTPTGFDVDANFRCGTGKAGSVIVGELVDIAALPVNNNMNAAVVGIDAGGTIVYCSANSDNYSASPLALPDAGWGQIKGIASLGSTLFVLDPVNNAVYLYRGSNGVYDSKPNLFFDATIPKMSDVVDLAIDLDYLYLLHADGSMTQCDANGFDFVPTRCTDPVPYGDPRQGREPAPLVFAGSQLAQLQITQPPDPSLYALDIANNSIYHLSLRRLNFQRQYRSMPDSDFPLPEGAPTAFAVTQNRRILLAFGNQVYFAPIE